MPKKKNKTKRRLIGCGVALFLLIALFVFLIVWFFGASYQSMKLFREEERIPYLKNGISPQGLCAVPQNEEGYTLAMSGYMTNGSPSRICLMGEGKAKYVTLTQDGEAVTTHFGGITASANYFLVASGTQMVRVSVSAILEAEDGASIEAYDWFETDINAAYCYFDYETDKLYVGEFYRAGNYKTQESHHITVNGETNYAFIYEYDGDEGCAGGVANQTPAKAYSVRGLVQGVAFTKDYIYLSTSYGLADSHLSIYSADIPQSGTAQVNRAEVPLYRLDSSVLQRKITLPCMSEEIFIKDGRLYILFESLCNKYKYFVRYRVDSVLSASLEDLNP